MIQIAKSFAAAGAILLLAACDVKDPIFDSPHPDHAGVTLTTEWSDIGEEVSVPESYKVQTGFGEDDPSNQYEATLTGVTNKLDHLFNPGFYRFYVYNTPEHVHVGGEWADVHTAPKPGDVAGESFIYGDIGFLFTSIQEITLERDKEYTITAPMKQQVRELRIILEPTLDTFTSIKGVFFGAAQACNYETDEHVGPSSVYLEFEKITSGAEAGNWVATVRLLGIAEQKQTLSLEYTDYGGTTRPVRTNIENENLFSAFESFNSDKRKPFEYRLSIHPMP